MLHFIEILYAPSRVLQEQKKKARLLPALIDLGLTGANVGVVGIFFLETSISTLKESPSLLAGITRIFQLAVGSGYDSLIFTPFLAAIVAIVGGSIFLRGVQVIAQKLGGNGSWVENMFLVSMLFLPIAIGTFFLNLIVILPLIGTFLSVAWGAYVFYIASRAVAVANTLSLARGMAALVLPLLAVGIISIFLGS